MKPLSLPLIGLVLLLALATAARADVTMRISVKFILSSGGAMPCCGNGTFDSFADITNQVNFANEMLRSFGRGYQFQIFEVTTVGGPASAFYSNSRDDKDLLEAAAEADKPGFKYRDNAINMYVNDANGSAVCSFPPDDDIILFGQSSRTTSLWHESGHYFNLKHTHQGATEQNSNGTACTNGCSCAQLIGGTTDGTELPDRGRARECVAPNSSVAPRMARLTPLPITIAGATPTTSRRVITASTTAP